jgi:translation initiation factor 2-alpha kinase 4
MSTKLPHRVCCFIDAIKKIELESEEGKYASVAAIQNRKLRREVTTISRMLHKNIVRYYQAWVEGGEDTDTPIVEGPDDDENVQVVQSEDAESSEDEASSGWWTNSPTEGVHDNLLERSNGDGMGDFSEHSSDGWVAEDDDTIDMSNPRSMPPRRDNHSASIEDLLGQEHDFQVRLMNCIALRNGLKEPELTLFAFCRIFFY